MVVNPCFKVRLTKAKMFFPTLRSLTQQSLLEQLWCENNPIMSFATSASFERSLGKYSHNIIYVKTHLIWTSNL